MENYITDQNNEAIEKNFEMAHMLGLNSKIRNSVQCHPSLPDTLIYTVGGTIVIEDMNDKNNQVFFKHGNYQISCFKVSNTGAYLAVGFSQPPLDKNFPTSVLLWDFVNKTVITEFKGIFKQVNHLSFSQDDKFLAATGLDCSLFIWDINTRFKSISSFFEFPLELIYWSSWDNSIKYPSYELLIADCNKIHKVKFFHELKSMQYASKFELFPTQPRSYTSVQTCEVLNNYYMGNKLGEINIFRTSNNLFKASFKVVNNGVNYILLVDPETMLVGGGDGKVVKILNKDGEHFLVKEAQLVGSVSSMSLSCDKREVIVSTSAGCIYRLMIADFVFSFYSVANTAAVNSICFGTASDKFFSGDSNVLH